MASVTMEAAKEMGRSLGMSETDVEGYKTQFDACDEDGGGTISNDELKTVLRKCGVQVSNAEVERYIKEFDTDGDGVLDFGEFLGMMHKFNAGPSERDTRKAMYEVREHRGGARALSQHGRLRPPAPLPIFPAQHSHAIAARGTLTPRLSPADAGRQPRRPGVAE